MQALKFAKALEEISRQLKAQELVEFLKPYIQPEATNTQVTPQDRSRFATLLFDSRVGFTELSRNEDTNSLLNAFHLEDVYDSGRLAHLIAVLANVPTTHAVIGNVEMYKTFLGFYESLSSVVNFATVSARFLVAEKIHPPTEGDEVLELLILDYDATGVLAQRVQQSLTSLIELHTHLSRILGITDGGLKIAYTDSGSDILVGIAGATLFITTLRLLFNEYWEKVKFQRFSEFDRSMQSLEKGLTLNTTLSAQVAAGALSDNDAKVLRERVMSEMAKLIGNGTTIPLESAVHESPDERKLLTYMRDTKLLSVGDGETSPPGPEPEKKEKDDTGDAKN
jgi:hypothetical protein